MFIHIQYTFMLHGKKYNVTSISKKVYVGWFIHLIYYYLRFISKKKKKENLIIGS